MAEIVRHPLDIEAERLEELRMAERAGEAERLKRENEYRIAKLKYATQPRYKSVERIFITLAKVLALPVAVICITVLAARDQEIPESLNKFLAL